MDLVTALYQSITQGRTPGDLTDREMVRIVAADRATRTPEGISERTWRRLRAEPGRKMMWRTRQALERAVADLERRAKLSARRERRLRGKPIIKLTGDIQISADRRHRTLNISDWPDPPIPGAPPITGMMGPVLSEWLPGRDLDAVRRFMAPVNFHLGADVIVHDVTELHLR